MAQKRRRFSRNKPDGRPIGFWPSHHRFAEMVDFCIRGKSNPTLQTCTVGDHIVTLSDLLAYDVDRYLWHRTAPPEGLQARRILTRLTDRVRKYGCLEAANTIYAIAAQGAFEVLDLYLRSREIFDRIAARHKTLPTLASIHPLTAKIIGQMSTDARLGKQTDDARRIGSKTWFVSDTPASVYARAIITSVRLNRSLEPISQQQRFWATFDRKQKVQTIVLPFPKYLAGLDQIPIPITPASVLQYWHKGKEMILEEMPDFHERPEWEKYRQGRNYRDGAKKGAVQHAIFKDILTALRTIAGSYHGRASSSKVTK